MADRGGSAVLQRPLRGVVGKCGTVAQVQLRPDAVSVGLDRLDAEVQTMGNVGRLRVLADKTKYLQLAIGQCIEWRTRDFILTSADGAANMASTIASLK